MLWLSLVMEQMMLLHFMRYDYLLNSAGIQITNEHCDGKNTASAMKLNWRAWTFLMFRQI